MKKILLFITFISLILPHISQASVSFDGSNDFINAGSAGVLDNLAPMTITAWIYPLSEGELGGGVIAAKDGTNTGFNYFSFGVGTNNLEFGKDGTTDLLRRTANNTLVLKKWQNVVVTWDGSATAANVHIYIDGVESSYQTTTNGASLVSDSSNNFIIGNSQSAAFTFDGLIDEVRVYKRALSANEIKALYRGREVWNGIVGYWPLWGTGDKEQDLSGKKNLGVPTNFTVNRFGRSNPPLPAYAQF